MRERARSRSRGSPPQPRRPCARGRRRTSGRSEARRSPARTRRAASFAEPADPLVDLRGRDRRRPFSFPRPGDRRPRPAALARLLLLLLALGAHPLYRRRHGPRNSLHPDTPDDALGHRVGLALERSSGCRPEQRLREGRSGREDRDGDEVERAGSGAACGHGRPTSAEAPSRPRAPARRASPSRATRARLAPRRGVELLPKLAGGLVTGHHNDPPASPESETTFEYLLWPAAGPFGAPLPEPLARLGVERDHAAPGCAVCRAPRTRSSAWRSATAFAPSAGRSHVQISSPEDDRRRTSTRSSTGCDRSGQAPTARRGHDCSRIRGRSAPGIGAGSHS